MHTAPPRVDFQSLVGVWTRRSIRWPDGRQDTTTRVFWLQGQPDYADIRIPHPRPSFSGATSLADCTAAQKDWLAEQHGFAGTLQNRDGDWLWARELDYQPFN